MTRPDPCPDRHGTALPWAEARLRAYAAGRAGEPVEVPLSDAAGATLAAPLVAPRPLPGADVAAMDGYAVAGTGPWRVVHHLLADAVDPGRLGPGAAAEIATGAPVPAGADAVLPYEAARRRGATVTGDIAAGRHIRRTGEAVPARATLAGSGAAVTPALLGLAGGLGLDALCVRRRPRVRAVICGAEIVPAGPPGPGRVRDALGPALPGLVAGSGGDLAGLTRVGDDRRDLAAALADPAGDVLLTCGGSSAGPSDALPAVLRDTGAEIHVAGVACRPGHPQTLAVLPDGRPVVGLPGNPFAALVALLTLLGPLCAGLTGRPMPMLATARLAAAVPPPERTRVLPVRRTDGATVVPTGHDGPASLWGAAVADALAVVPQGWACGPVDLLELPGC